MAKLAIEVEAHLVPETDAIRLYLPSEEDIGMGDSVSVPVETMSVSYDELAEAVMQDVDFGDISHSEALEIAEQLSSVAVAIRQHIRLQMKPARDE